MKKRQQTVAGMTVRPVSRFWLLTAKYRKAILASGLSVFLLITGSAGFLLGNHQPVQAASLDDAAGIAAFNRSLTVQEDLCKSIEQIDLETALKAEQDRNEDLSDSLASTKDEMDSLEDKILNALMANLTTQMVSRSSSTASAQAAEARNLLDLSHKLSAFKKTPESREINLTDYEAKITRRLANLPTLKPSSGNMHGYGYRYHPIKGYYHFHPAVDMSTDYGSPIRAAGGGTVVDAKYNASAGNFITINHGNGFTTTYMHCSKLLISAGDTVKKGELIGKVGSTGSSTGPHLHFEMRFYGEPVNPTSMIMQY